MVDQVELDSERSRIRNMLVNSGRCKSFAEAEQRLATSRLHIQISEHAAVTPAGQAATLTAVVTAARSFGSVTVSGALDQPLVVPLPLHARSLVEAATELGALPSNEDHRECRNVLIGLSALVTGWSVQAQWDGWLACVRPGDAQLPLGRSDCTLAGIAAGALAVGQAFLAEQGNARAGRMVDRLSLWNPDLPLTDNPGPALSSCSFPLELWLIGLGNLGQAYLWSLASLPYRRSEQVLLFLQDDDILKRENWGTSILAERGRYGVLKTRIAEEWAQRRGFAVRRIDRRLDQYMRRSDQEPGMVLAGLDKMSPRRLLGVPGFEYVIDAGLGATVADYRSVRVSCFGPGENPADRFAGVEDVTDAVAAELRKMPAYLEIERAPEYGLCGAATLAGQAVVVPFVSAVAGAMAIAQAVRITSGEQLISTLTADIADLRTMRAAPGQAPTRVALKIDTAA